MTLGRNAKQLDHTLRNLVSSLIQHESITTTKAKAKLTQSMIENLITKTKNTDLTNPAKVASIKEKLRGTLYNHDITLPKMLNDLRSRYANRTGGYTRILKLENRIGDNAPQVILELVDSSKREMKFWMTAKIVARLELQELPLDKLTKGNVKELLMLRENGKEEFRKAVDICKQKFFSDPESLVNLPRMKSDKNGFHHFFSDVVVVPRETKQSEKTSKQ